MQQLKLFVRRASMVSILSLMPLVGCYGNTSVNDLFLFEKTASDSASEKADYKAINTLVTVRLSSNSRTFSSTQVSAQNFILRCYDMDSGGLQVAFAGADGSTESELPVQLTGPSTQLTLEVRVPQGVQPGPSGYNFHFSLARPDAPIKLARKANSTKRFNLTHSLGAQVVGTQLDAVRAEVMPGTPASDNPVDLSIASSLAYTLAASTVSSVDLPRFLVAHSSLTALLFTEQQSIEASVNAGVGHSLDDYAQALRAALESALLQKPALQAQAAEILATAAAATDPTSKLSQNFAVAFSEQMGQLAQNVNTIFRSEDRTKNSGVLDVFIPAVAAAQVAAGENLVAGAAVYAPSSLAFVDLDVYPTIGGQISIQPPAVKTGLTGYRVYLGDAHHTPASLHLLGQLTDMPKPMLMLPMGTPVPTGATTLWAEALSGTTSLGFTGNTLANRVSNLSGLQAIAGARQITLEWSPVLGITNYNVYRSASSPVTSRDTKLTTGTNNFVDTGLVAGVTYFYAISTGGNNCDESELSQEVSATPAALARPRPVVELSAKGTVDDIQVRWIGVSGATYYAVSRTSDTSAVPEFLTNTTDTSYTDLNTTYGESYQYTVITVSAAGSSVPSVTRKAKLELSPPGLSCAAAGQTVVDCSVSLPPEADLYKWYRSTTLPVTLNDLVDQSRYPVFQESIGAGVVYYAVSAIDASGQESALSVAEGVSGAFSYPPSGAPAMAVWGQQAPSGAYTGSRTEFLSEPVGVAVDNHDTLFVSFPNENSIRGFRRVRTLSKEDLGFVLLGQAKEGQAQAGASSVSLSRPLGLAVDTITQNPVLLATDADNARVNIYDNTLPATWRQPALLSLGAADPNAVGNGIGANGLASSTAFLGVTTATIRTGHTLVVDTAANRVLVYNSLPSSGEQQPDFVIGQESLDYGKPNHNGISASTLNHPTSAWTDGQRLVVYDAGNARVLLWNSMPSTNFAPADLVIGQQDMSGSAANGGGAVDAYGLAGLTSGDLPATVTSNGQQLAIADTLNNRILIFQQFPTADHAAADVVLGQPDFTSTAAASFAGASDLNAPTGMTYWNNTHLIVADTGNKRVVMF